MNPPRPRATSPRWAAELALRVRRYLLLKIVGVSAVTWLFFIGYFHLLRNPAFEVLQMPLTPLDHLIPFQPHWLVAYLSLWFYVGIAPGLMMSLRALIGYGLWVGALCVSGLAAFYFWPNEVPLRTMDVTDFPGFAMLQGVDAAGNACPSMHVAVAMFSAIWLDALLRSIGTPVLMRIANALWFAAIAYSTLAIKQHVVLDVLAGGLLGLAFAWPSLRFLHAALRADVQVSADIIASR